MTTVTIARLLMFAAVAMLAVHIARTTVAPELAVHRAARRAAVSRTCYACTSGRSTRRGVWVTAVSGTDWVGLDGRTVAATKAAATLVRLPSGMWGRPPTPDELHGAVFTVTSPVRPTGGDVVRIDVQWPDGRSTQVLADPADVFAS